MKKIISPLEKKVIRSLKAGDEVLFDGILYTARDQAHQRLTEAIRQGKQLPVDLKESVIYYCGPTQTPEGKAIGACGPTTSRRMDVFTPALIKAGLRAMIGKGGRSPEVIAALKKYSAVYFLTYAGCGALLSKYVRRSTPVAYADLGPEAIYRLEVRDFPLIVGIDARGKSVYKE
ncbi:MAG: FumA C-terminus/TtdB family hydratase beta subunit [Candidatus Omnitrophota bacterium]|jgi:fumarate hydratase subunit beta